MADEREETGALHDPYDRTNQDLPPGMNPAGTGQASLLESAEEAFESMADEEAREGIESESWLIQKAQEIYAGSTDYLHANITNAWEKNLAHFNNEHAPGTMYARKDFKRSRVFRPKTRANIKQQEAALANAAFSTLNLVDVRPVNPRDPMQKVAAAVHKAVLELRLGYLMPWYLTVQGAYQNTKVYGLCITHQYWDYHEDTDIEPAFDSDGKPEMDEEGNALGYEKPVVRRDRLACDLVEPENFRFDPMCDWRNPAQDSPYLIHIYPIYAGEVMEMAEIGESKTGQKKWRKYSLSEILATRRETYDRVRQAREGRDRIDPADQSNSTGGEYTIVWAHRNIIKVDGTDYEYWTLGTELLLTDPVKLTESQPWLRDGERPYVVGYSSVEAHRNFPAGDVEQGAPLQEEINQVANQRLDNVKLVLNKRYFVRRGSQVDLDALIRNVPGGGVMMNDPEKDVQTVNTPDVTGSSYNEQNLLGREYDELVGGFNPASNQGQSSVAGQQLGQATAGAVQDYGIKTFIETWMEPVLRQLQRLEAMYETDETILAVAGEQAQVYERLRTAKVTDALMMQNLFVRVDIGMGNTDPMRKVERLIFGVRQTSELPGMAARLKPKEIADSVFGALGFRDSDQFVMTDDEFAEFQEANPQGPGEAEIKLKELEIRREDNKLRDERERMKMAAEYGFKGEDLEARKDMKMNELMAQLAKSRGSDETQRDLKAADLKAKTREMNIKEATGEGI